MPSRIIREGINSSRAIGRLPEEVELLYRSLLLIVDDYGRMEADSELIRAGCFVRRLEAWPPERVERCLLIAAQALTDNGLPLIRMYQVKSKTYLEITNFDQRTRGKSKVPCPQNCNMEGCQRFGHKYPAGDSAGDAPTNGSTPRTTAARATRAHSESKSNADAKSDASACAESKSEHTHTPETAVAPANLPPKCEARIRAVAALSPDTQDLQNGIAKGVELVQDADDPAAVLRDLETNLPLWFAAMREGRARVKSLWFILADGDYMQKPREPSAITGPVDKHQKRRDEANKIAKAMRQAR